MVTVSGFDLASRVLLRRSENRRNSSITGFPGPSPMCDASISSVHDPDGRGATDVPPRQLTNVGPGTPPADELEFQSGSSVRKAKNHASADGSGMFVQVTVTGTGTKMPI